LERHVSPQLAASLNLLLLLVAIVVPAILLFTMAATQALAVANEASSWINDRLIAGSAFENFRVPLWVPFEVDLEAIRAELSSKVGQIAGTVGRFLVGTFSQVTQATAMFLLDVFVAAYFFFYCLQNGKQLSASVVESLPLDREGREDLIQISSAVTRSVLKSIVIIGAVQGILSGLAFWVVGVDQHVFWGVVMGFLSVIPFIGPIIIWLPVAVYLGVSGSYWEAAFLAGWFWLVVASVDNVLRPMLVGQDTQMPDVLVLLTTLGGLFMFGAIGLVVGPLIGALLMASWEVYQRTFASELGHEQIHELGHAPEEASPGTPDPAQPAQSV
jgi:predicted PurR-regulated permease PerM